MVDFFVTNTFFTDSKVIPEPSSEPKARSRAQRNGRVEPDLLCPAITHYKSTVKSITVLPLAVFCSATL